MAGSKGQVTLKLEQPVVIDALTVDHVPTAIIPDGKEKSAPKRIVVVAYPPCAVDDGHNSDTMYNLQSKSALEMITGTP